VPTLFGGRSKAKVVKMKYFGFSILAAFLSAKASMQNMDPSGYVNRLLKMAHCFKLIYLKMVIFHQLC
jgi:hypothetical protein